MKPIKRKYPVNEAVEEARQEFFRAAERLEVAEKAKKEARPEDAERLALNLRFAEREFDMAFENIGFVKARG